MVSSSLEGNIGDKRFKGLKRLNIEQNIMVYFLSIYLGTPTKRRASKGLVSKGPGTKGMATKVRSTKGMEY
jgi:hypothetical protein